MSSQELVTAALLGAGQSTDAVIDLHPIALGLTEVF